MTSFNFYPNPDTLGTNSVASIAFSGGSPGTYTCDIWEAMTLAPDMLVDNFSIAYNGISASYGTTFSPPTIGSFHMSLVFNGNTLWSQPSDGTRLTVSSPAPTTTTTTTTPTTPTPPTVVTWAATNITSSSATLNGELTDSGTAKSGTCSYQYGTSPTNYTNVANWTYNGSPIMWTNITWDSGSPSSSASLQVAIAINGLSPNTTYYFRAVATGDGTGYGGQLSFTTSAP